MRVHRHSLRTKVLGEVERYDSRRAGLVLRRAQHCNRVRRQCLRSVLSTAISCPALLKPSLVRQCTLQEVS
jgi:hypothetical protein